MKRLQGKLACIVCYEFQWQGVGQKECPIIYTLRFPGETEEGFRQNLDEALAKLPFRTLYWYATFADPDLGSKFREEMEVEEVVDYPGAEDVEIKIRFSCKRKFFLPRGPEGFIDLEKQTQCLKILKIPAVWKKRKKNK